MSPLTPFKKDSRVKLKKTGALGTVTEVHTHGAGTYLVVKVFVRLDGEKEARQYEEPELEQVRWMKF